MGQHKYGRNPKIGYATRQEAEDALVELSHPVHKSNVYKCRCGLWHRGRMGFTRRQRYEHLAPEKRDIYLVGQIMKALRPKAAPKDIK